MGWDPRYREEGRGVVDGFRVEGSGCRVQGWSMSLGVRGLEFRVQNSSWGDEGDEGGGDVEGKVDNPGVDKQSTPKPQHPAPQPQHSTPQTPTSDPQTPTPYPQTPTSDPQIPTSDPQTPTSEPQTPASDPQTGQIGAGAAGRRERGRGEGAGGVPIIRRLWGLCRVSLSLPGPVDPSFQALSGRLKLTTRRNEFNRDSLSAQSTSASSPRS